MKKITILIVILALLYFIVGYIVIYLNYWDREQYFNFSAIIGGIASVSGLLTFVISGVKRKDIEQIGLNYLRDVIKASGELKEKENELLKKAEDLTKKEKELRQLEIRKKELEYLVQKSSMILFLKDQHSRTKEKIIEIINSRELRKLYSQFENIELQIEALETEIEKSEEVEFLKKVSKELNNHKIKIKKNGIIEKFYDVIIQLFDE